MIVHIIRVIISRIYIIIAWAKVGTHFTRIGGGLMAVAPIAVALRVVRVIGSVSVRRVVLGVRVGIGSKARRHWFAVGVGIVIVWAVLIVMAIIWGVLGASAIVSLGLIVCAVRVSVAIIWIVLLVVSVALIIIIIGRFEFESLLIIIQCLIIVVLVIGIIIATGLAAILGRIGPIARVTIAFGLLFRGIIVPIIAWVRALVVRVGGGRVSVWVWVLWSVVGVVFGLVSRALFVGLIVWAGLVLLRVGSVIVIAALIVIFALI